MKKTGEFFIYSGLGYESLISVAISPGWEVTYLHHESNGHIWATTPSLTRATSCSWAQHRSHSAANSSREGRSLLSLKPKVSSSSLVPAVQEQLFHVRVKRFKLKRRKRSVIFYRYHFRYVYEALNLNGRPSESGGWAEGNQAPVARLGGAHVQDELQELDGRVHGAEIVHGTLPVPHGAHVLAHTRMHALQQPLADRGLLEKVHQQVLHFHLVVRGKFGQYILQTRRH